MIASRRVLHLVPSFGGGGAETQLANLCTELVKRNWRVDVLHLTGGPNLERFQSSGAIIHKLPVRSNYDPSMLWRTIRAIRDLRPDLVQTWIPMMDLVGGASARLLGIPWVLSERSSPLMFSRTLKFNLRELVARGASCVVSNSAGGDDYWATVLPSGVLRAVIGNALPIEEIDAARPAVKIGFGLDDMRPLILYIGRFNADKNISNLVRALRRVFAETNAVALLCGIGPELESIRRQIARENIASRVVAPGFVSEPISLLKRASISISLSRYEGMPNAAMEAAAAGCPLILSDIPAHRAIFDDSMVDFVDVNSIESSVTAMIAALRDSETASLRAAAAREASRAWSPANLASEYERVYFEVIERSGRRK